MSERVVALFCGSRDWGDTDAIRADIEALPPHAVVVHGNQRGADKMADYWARQLGLHVAPVDAHWDHYGRAAGPRRNAAMLMLLPTVVYAYPLGGPGTRNMIERAEAAGVQVYERSAPVLSTAGPSTATPSGGAGGEAHNPEANAGPCMSTEEKPER